MITREDIRELSQIDFREGEDCALSFYFQPLKPRDKSHREAAILAKDLVKNAQRELEKSGGNGCAKADLDRIADIAGHLRGNQARAKAVFAHGARKLWREFDLPPLLPGTQLFVNRRFHLRPLAMLLNAQPRLCVLLLDRQRARFLDLFVEDLSERPGMFRPLPRRGRGDGFAGYDGGHAARSIADQSLHHFKDVAQRLKDEAEKGVWDKLVIGCQNVTWREFEPHLHTYVKQRVLGNFSSDVASAVRERVREHATRILHRSLAENRARTVKEVLSRAGNSSQGVTGLRRVLRSLQLGEVQTLLMAENYSARAVECTSCGYLDSHLVRFCPACGRATRELEDVADAILPLAIRRDIDLLFVKDDPELDRVGNIAALLRFRTNTAPRRLATAS